MSSAKNHRIRSHRSYHNQVSTAEHFKRTQSVKHAYSHMMKQKKGFFESLFSMFRKGDRKSGNVKGRKEE